MGKRGRREWAVLRSAYFPSFFFSLLFEQLALSVAQWKKRETTNGREGGGEGKGKEK
jgi:hypothetical protein